MKEALEEIAKLCGNRKSHSSPPNDSILSDCEDIARKALYNDQPTKPSITTATDWLINKTIDRKPNERKFSFYEVVELLMEFSGQKRLKAAGMKEALRWTKHPDQNDGNLKEGDTLLFIKDNGDGEVVTFTHHRGYGLGVIDSSGVNAIVSVSRCTKIIIDKALSSQTSLT